ncbi:uracil-DNA glycosylase [Roseibium aquae]|uniref:Type-4 uracil-DNA glycosylase n=1 Tax=Roseibium aquae TaxID=1323746 RepID=A0A916TLP3_9HYPH|nr:uracil-DNA glycosylase [Roseibium aquae]GGB51927.1 uracil-DNA glycosylase [Roseibium aquae]
MQHDNPVPARELEALVDFYVAGGVDAFLEDQPVDRFERSAQVAAAPGPARAPATGLATGGATRAVPRAVPGGRTGAGSVTAEPTGTGWADAPASVMPVPAQTAPSLPANPAGTPVVPDRAAIQSARDLAQGAETLEELYRLLAGFDGCNLRLTAKNLVFADGNPAADIMFIGEAPGREEDNQGKPFVGRSGQLLDRMLSAIGLDRSSAYIANVVPWRPPGNRTPTPQETELCKPFIQRQIELADPKVLVFLGAASAKTLLGVQDGIRRLRGRWMDYDARGRAIPCLATYHPAYLLRSPLEKRLSWRDFLEVKARLTRLTQG